MSDRVPTPSVTVTVNALTPEERAEFKAVADELGKAVRVYEIVRGLQWFKRGDGRWDVIMRSLTHDRAHELHELVFGEGTPDV